jgi:hypothetical protein
MPAMTQTAGSDPTPAATRAPRERPSYWLTRFLVLRLLGLVYLAAFASFAWQALPLLGKKGLLPAADWLGSLGASAGSRLEGFRLYPSFFWLDVSDGALLGAGLLGIGLSLPLLLGFANAVQLALLWALQLSVIQIGQLWYGYGWEIQLAETGFLAIFLCPLRTGRAFPASPPPATVIWLLRWLIFRIMLGAGLIKLRGDPCWRDLTCLFFHYETQPIPNPLSRAFHRLPHSLLQGGVLFNHLAELVAPWFLVAPRRFRHAAGAVMLAFQLALIVGGNLSFLNWLTMVPILACFDDSLLRRLLPRRLVARAEQAAAAARPARAQRGLAIALVVLIAVLSVGPVVNLLSSQQIMNTSFDRLALVNSYGAFGTVGRERDEIVFEGTSDEPLREESEWRAYEFPCKPGDPLRRPCVVSPFQPRLDWQIWFAAMATPNQYPWTLHFVWKLLEGDRGVLRLLANDPFPEAPPRWVRARLYRYRFAEPDDPSGAWWTRELLGDWLPPLSAKDPRLREALIRMGWLVPGDPGAPVPTP